MRRALVVLLLATLSLLAVPGTASAVDIPGVGVDVDTCGSKEFPGVTSPDSGIVGWLTPFPENPPPHANPWLEGTSTSVYEQYGSGTPGWWTYDAGCFNVMAPVNEFTTDMLVFIPKAVRGFVAAFTDFAYAPTEWIGAFDPVIHTVQDALRESIWVSGIILAVALTGLFILFNARNGRLAPGLTAVIWVTLMIVASATLSQFPTQAAQAADETITTITGSGSRAIVGVSDEEDSITATINNATRSTYAEQAWRMGVFGCAECPAAEKYGPIFTRATMLSWAETQDARSNPTRGAEIIQVKEAQFAGAAAALKDEFPEAYQHFTGNRTDGKFAGALILWFGMFAIEPWILMSSILLIVAFVLIRVLVMTSPAWLTIGAVPKLEGVARGAFTVAAAAIVNSCLFALIGAVYIRIASELMMSTVVPLWWALVLCLLLGLIMWRMAKPFRRLHTMVSPSTNFAADAAAAPGEFFGKAKSAAMKVGLAAAGSGIGNTLADRLQKRGDSDDAQPDDGPPVESNSETEDGPIQATATTDYPEFPALSRAASRAQAAPTHDDREAAKYGLGSRAVAALPTGSSEPVEPDEPDESDYTLDDYGDEDSGAFAPDEADDDVTVRPPDSGPTFASDDTEPEVYSPGESPAELDDHDVFELEEEQDEDGMNVYTARRRQEDEDDA